MGHNIKLEEYKMVVRDILNNHLTASLSTMNDMAPHSNTIYYCYDDNFDIYFASDYSTEHAINIDHNKKVAMSIWNEPKQYGLDHQGLQIEGICTSLSGFALIKAWDLYIKRFPIFKLKIGDVKNIVEKIVNMRLYKVSVSRIQITNTKRYCSEIITISNDKE